ncbi:uridine kinase [Bacillus horti]|uniref:Uridine kinase n=1 Tax=Caldalkalibacillus horti TaxID=77523 RepID=A0ABT9VT96_9BACI|nr:uridine kinase [Bacillus horti]MDQ0164213.1 uridine kinase [Bacillus horti]
MDNKRWTEELHNSLEQPVSKPIVIGLAGGTGSGKTTVAKRIVTSLKEQSIVMIAQDSYYKDQAQMPMEERVKTNYDHPFAFDNDLLLVQIKQLLQYQPIQVPIYNFKEHTRSKETIEVKPKNVIILEGILVLEDERLRELMDMKLFVDTAADVRIIRRMLRDIQERGRTMGSVVEQYLSIVRPMHEQFVEPSKKYADIIIPEGGENQVAIDLMVTKIKSILKKHELLQA